ncbi:MAG: S8 family serine peptidase [Balneolaceae bacterium]|nr:S8 family serine peptidase [Balneolaceae bacterium]
MCLTFGVPSAKKSDLKFLENANRELYLKTNVIPNIPDPDPAKPFWDAVENMAKNIGEALWDEITGNNYTPPSDLEKLRQKLWEVAQPTNNGVNVAPAGDVYNQDVLEILMSANFDNYVVTVAGAEKDPLTEEYAQWANSQAAPYVDVAAAANNIVSTSGTAYGAYNEDFNSTAASAGIGAGVVSLLKAEEPSLTHDDIEEVLKRTAIDLESTGEDEKTGAGFIDADAALSFVQNNDVIQHQISSSEISITGDELLFSDWIIMEDYLTFTSTNATEARGKLKKVTGEVNFELPFSAPPEVWLRMSSSGIDTDTMNSGLGYVHYYDPYDKIFEVTSVTTEGFTFELNYWLVEYYNSLIQLVETKKIPNVNGGLTLDYTAIGQEETYWPVSVYKSGLDAYAEGSEGYWEAQISGGQGPFFSTTWYRSYHEPGSTPNWSEVGTGTTYNQTVTHNMYLRTLVVDNATGESAEDVMYVSVVDCDNPNPDGECPQPKALPENAVSDQLPEEYAITQNYPNRLTRPRPFATRCRSRPR